MDTDRILKIPAKPKEQVPTNMTAFDFQENTGLASPASNGNKSDENNKATQTKNRQKCLFTDCALRQARPPYTLFV
jgi:hypothetical protein